MPCFRPLQAYRSSIINTESGKRSTVFNPTEAWSDEPEGFKLPCGQCQHCRLAHSRDWATRAVLESKMYEDNCFVTLTYKDEYLPKGGSLDYSAAPLFMMRLRERFGSGIRSFGCAEYGEEFRRPHFHLCIFNFDFKDKKHWRMSGEFQLYRSEALEQLWPFGHSSIGDLTFETAAYTARYVMKKITGGRAAAHYGEEETIHPLTGEITKNLTLNPERSICVSRNPGLGRPWYEKFGPSSCSNGYIPINGKKFPIPKYFLNRFDVDSPEISAIKKAQRKRAGEEANRKIEEESLRFVSIDVPISHAGEMVETVRYQIPAPHRLDVIEKVTQLKTAQLKRAFECPSSNSSQSMIPKLAPSHDLSPRDPRAKRYVLSKVR